MEDFPKEDNMQQLSDDDLEKVAGVAFGDRAKRECKEAAYIACQALFASAGLGDC